MTNTEPINVGITPFFILSQVDEEPKPVAGQITSILPFKHPVHGECAELMLTTANGKSIIIILPIGFVDSVKEVLSVPF